MFRTKAVWCLLVTLVCVFPVFSEALAEQPKPSVSIGGSQLLLMGSGMRSRMFIDLYVGSLYVSNLAQSADAVIVDDKPMAIGLEVESSLITSDKLKDATKDGFEKSIGDTSAMDARIEKLLSAFDGPVAVGDQFYLAWNPTANAIQVVRNGEVIESVLGLDFKRALFGIWLGDDPVQDSLKEGMLGQG